jgi:hypothetical protein
MATLDGYSQNDYIIGGDNISIEHTFFSFHMREDKITEVCMMQDEAEGYFLAKESGRPPKKQKWYKLKKPIFNFVPG